MIANLVQPLRPLLYTVFFFKWTLSEQTFYVFNHFNLSFNLNLSILHSKSFKISVPNVINHGIVIWFHNNIGNIGKLKFSSLVLLSGLVFDFEQK